MSVATLGPAEVLGGRPVRVIAQRIAVLRAVSTSPHATANDIAEVRRSEIGGE